jgi:hypothetical protein
MTTTPIDTFAKLTGLSSNAMPFSASTSNVGQSAPAAAAANPAGATITTVAMNGGGSTVAVTAGNGFTIDLNFDAAATAAPASFRAGIEQAAAILASTITNQETVNIAIDYAGVGGGAGANSNNVQANYATVRADLIQHAAPGDTIFNALPATTTFQGQTNIAVSNAEAKALGLIAANSTNTLDGFATFATDINPNSLVGVALHELTHALGRVPTGPQANVFDLFRFTSPGQNLVSGAQTAPPAYFSLNGGLTKLADLGQTGDPSDFLNTGVQGMNDPFNEFYNGATSQQLSPIDMIMLNALGFNTTGPSVQTLLTQVNQAPVGNTPVATAAPPPAAVPTPVASMAPPTHSHHHHFAAGPANASSADAAAANPANASLAHAAAANPASTSAAHAAASPAANTSVAHTAAAEASHAPQPDTSMQDHMLASHLLHTIWSV